MPHVLTDLPEILAHTERLRTSGRTIGFVPTMGALHEGHLSLMRQARQKCDTLIASIYVNPLQFGPQEDFSKYPRPKERDLALCDEAGVDLVLHLNDAQMYPSTFATHVEVAGLTDHLCGAGRPGHFRGVTTVVTKLLNLARPHRAYFGQKDAQQALVIRRMAMDLNTGIDIIICPTVREADGLALSSRNAYLTPEQRNAAPALYRGLQEASQAFHQGEAAAGVLKQRFLDTVSLEPAVRLEYAEIVDAETVSPVDNDRRLSDTLCVFAVAAHVGTTRLIDNIVLPPDATL